MATKSVPARPVPRIYLATPELDDPAPLIASLPGLLATADVAAVLVRLKPVDQRSMISRAKALASAVQDNGAALLLDGRVELVARAGADGAHLTGIAALQEAFLTKTYEEWEAILLPAGVPMGAINTLDQVLAHPQVVARGALVESTHPVAGRVKMVGPPVRLSGTPGEVRRPAPLLGEHTNEVLRERLGLSDAEISALSDAGSAG